jgi:gliding motility-associated-like protein
MTFIKESFYWFVVFLFIFPFCGFTQNGVPHTLYQQYNGPYDYTIIGNTHNPSDAWGSPSPPFSSMLTSSSANLNLTTNQTIVAAYLTWTGISNGLNTTLTVNGSTFIPDFVNVTDPFPQAAATPYFSAVKDITSFVQSTGNGNYQVTNFNLNPFQGNYYSSAIYFAGWNIIVVYSNPTLPNKQLNIYDGFRFVSNGSGVPLINFPINNLNVTNISGAKMTMLSFMGNSTVILGQTLKVNNSTLSNAQNPASNPFNSTNSFTNSSTSWQMDVDTYPINNYINVGDVSFVITAGAALPTFFSTIITSIQSELPDATISLDSITGQDICQNQDLTLDYTVYNVNSNDTLLAGTPISVYANNNVLLSTMTLPSNILIGDSLSLSTLVNIPASIASPFTLSMVVNQNSTQLGVYPESNFGNNTSNDSTISLTTVIYPNFGNVGTFCQGTNYTLPSVSLNNVVGVWSPAFDNQSSGTYYFLPNDTTCNQPLQLTVQIVPQTTPLFNFATSLCQNDNLLFPVSTQTGAFGTWTPAFNNQSTTTYTFTPTISSPALGCPTSAQHTVNIIPSTVPTFNLLDSICLNGQLTFPAVSTNSISGTWSPAFDNQNSTTYTFTPSISTLALGCPSTTQHTVNIISPTVSTFSFLDTICLNGQLTFPTVSDNSISGTWSPAFDNQNSATYTFTPDLNNTTTCVASAQQDVVIVPPTAPNFSLVNSLCEGSSFVFPTTSINGISGTWTPAFNNQTSATYTFNPDISTVLGACASSVNQTMTIIPTLSPSFNFADSLCEDAAFNFPDVSIEGITGIWTPTFNNQATQNYTFTPSSIGIVSTSQGLRCPQVVNQILTILPNPVADFTPQYSVLPLYMPSTILDNNSSNAYTYFWNFGDGTSNDSIFSPEHTFPEEAGSYLVSLQVSNQIGCLDTTSQIIVIEHDPVVFIPNAFTPDGDGLNNEFTAVFPVNMKLASFEMYIYDRWGELVFYSQDPKQGWDASLAGFDAPDGVYSYLVKYKELGYVNKFQVTGSVVVIR